MGYTQPYAKHRDYIKGGGGGRGGEGGEVVRVGGGESGGWGGGGGGGACHTHLSKGQLGELQCRRKSTQDSRIFENINLCHASLVQNNVIRAS